MKDAIDIGYRHFDSAMIYGNDHEVGAAVRAKIADGTVKREDLFITNKVNSNITIDRPHFLCLFDEAQRKLQSPRYRLRAARPSAGTRHISLFQHVRTGSAHSAQINPPAHEADHSPASSVEVRKECSCVCTDPRVLP